MNTWTIEYDNDTGASDECYVEWWRVTNDKTSFKCNSEEDAVWLCSVLNAKVSDAPSSAATNRK